VLLLLIPLMPSPTLAVALLLVRSSISQMDVPRHQSYTMAQRGFGWPGGSATRMSVRRS
jgi:hypothetical protein